MHVKIGRKLRFAKSGGCRPGGRAIASVLALVACSAGAVSGADEPAAQRELLAAGERVARGIVRENNADRNYRIDLTLESLLELSATTNNPEWREHVFAILERRGTKPDSPAPFAGQSFGCLTFALYRATGDRAWLPVFLRETELCRRERPRSPEGAVMHPRGPQRGGGNAMLLDAMQEFACRMARAGVISNNADEIQECARQFRLYREVVRDPKTGLWSQGRGWLADRPNELSPGAWSRGHGWLLRGLTGALAELPRDSAEFRELQGYLVEFADALLPIQSENGMWRTLLHRPADQSPPDASGTAMIATAFSRAWREGWLTEPRVRDAARRAFAALPALADADGVVLSVSPGPGPLESEADYLVKSFPPGNDHGPFSFLFAVAEAVRLQSAMANDSKGK